jgi:hypothetical protein
MDDALLEQMRQEIAAGISRGPQQTQQDQTQTDSSSAPASDDQAQAPNAAPVDLVPEQTAADATGLRLPDLGRAVVGGVRDAAQGAIDTVNSIGAPKRTRIQSPGGGPREPDLSHGDAIPNLPEVARADESTTSGAILNAGRDIERFTLGFIGAGAALKGLGMAEGIGRTLAAGGLGDFLVTGAHDSRLVDFFDSFPALQNPVLDALHNAGSEDGELWKRKLVAAGEGVLTVGMIEGVVKLVGGLRNVIVAQRSGDKEAIQKAITEAEPDFQEALKATGEKPEEVPKVAAEEAPVDDGVSVSTNGDNFKHGSTGEDTPLPLSEDAKAEIKNLTANGEDVHFDKLSPETQAEVQDWIGKNPDAVPPPPAPEYKPAFEVSDAQKAEFSKALETSLSVPYATLRAENPGAGIEDVLGKFFNYRQMQSPDAVKLSLHSLAEQMRPMVEKIAGGPVQTFERVTELADWLGTKPDVLMGGLQRLAGDSEKMPALVVAGKTWMQSLTNDILLIAKKDGAGLATTADMAMMDHMTNVLGDLVGTVKSIQQAAARTTAAGRIATGAMGGGDAAMLRNQLGDKNFKLVSNLLGLTDNSPKAVIKLLEPTFGQKFMGVLNDYWINAVLSRPITQVVNITGNARNTFLYPLYRVAGGALTADRQSIQVGLAQYGALRNALFGSLEMTRRAFVSNAPILDVAAQQLEHQAWIKAGTFGVQDSSIFGTAINWLGNAIGMPSRFLTSADEFFGQLNYRASVEARARVEAYQQGMSDTKQITVTVDGKPVKVSELDKYVNEQMDAAFDPKNRSGYDQDGNALNPAAMLDSQRSKFTQPLKADKYWLGATTSLGEIANNAAARMPWFRHVAMPFTKVPANLFREMVAESPLAPIRAQFWADMSKGGEARSDAVGRLALGSMFSMGGAMLAAEGYITGQGPSDPQLNKQWRAAGNQPYSVRIPGAGENGKDLFIPYQRFDPVAGILGIIADSTYIMAHVDERTQNTMASTIAMSVANNLNAKGYLHSLSDLMAVLKSSRDANGPHVVQSYLNSRAASYIPGIVSSFKTDDTLREVRGMVDAMQAKVSGLAEGLPPMRDNFGAPMTTPVGWPWREVNPFAIAEGKSGPARTEMSHWGEGPTATKFIMPPPSVGGAVDLRDYKNPATGQNAYDRWMELVNSPMFDGKTAEERLNDLVSSDGYKELKKAGKEDPIYRTHPAAEMIREQLQMYYGAAREKMLSEDGFEDLRRALTQYSVNAKVVPLGASPPANPTLQQLLQRK